MSTQITIGVCGYAQSGKDTVANWLVEHHGFVKRSFADALRDDVWIMNPIVSWYRNEASWDPWSPITYQSAVRTHGYEEAKLRYPEIRRILQVYGTEVRRAEDPDVWLNRFTQWVQAHPEHERIVVPDVRFPNESDKVTRLIRVDRPGVGPVNAHVSDNLVNELPYDGVVINDGTIDKLGEAVDALIRLGRWLD